MKNCEILENESLKKYSTLGIGGIVKYLVKPKNVQALQDLIIELKNNNERFIILGNSSNVIIDDNFFEGYVIKLDNLDNIDYNDNLVTVGAGVKLPYFVNETLKNGYTSLAFAAMIPGTIGGSVVGNAGAYQDELLNYVKSVTVMDYEGNIFSLSKNEISFGYRYTSLKGKYIVLSVEFILSRGDVDEAKNQIEINREKRTNTQPLDKKSVGSIFRNPEGYSAGKLIEDLGLKGKTIGGAKVSEKHANFIINDQDASFNDIIELIKIIKKAVKENYDIDLVLEPTIINWKEV